ESTSGIGIRVRLWIEFHQALHVLVDKAGRDDAPRVGYQVLDLSGRAVGSRLIALFGDLGWGKVAVELAGRGYRRLQQGGIEYLIEVLVTSEEKQFIAILVEPG